MNNEPEIHCRAKNTEKITGTTSINEQTPLLNNFAHPIIKDWSLQNESIEVEFPDPAIPRRLSRFGTENCHVCSWEGSCASSAGPSTIQDGSSKSIQVGMLNLVSQKYEGFDYDTCENLIFLEEQRRKIAKSHAIKKGFNRIYLLKDSVTRTSILRWLVILLIGVLTACTACIITVAIDQLSSLKFSFLKKFVDHCSNYSCLIEPFGYWLMFCAVSVALGSFLVSFFAPIASGSGIPVIKCYLNGVKVPEVVRIKTLVVKAIGVITSVVGGLAVGKEGPMIHCGAVIAAGISQGKSTTFRKDCKIFEKFREDHEKRDFVSAGAAAGVAAAFGAPVGGVLFSLEEGASFWNQALTLRIFFCSMVSTFTLNLILSAYYNHPGQLSYPGLLNFGKFENITYSILEIPMYIFMGIVGGLLGALYNQLNYKLSVFRLRYVNRPILKVLEAVTVSVVGATLAFLTMVLTPYCQNSGTGAETLRYPIQLSCNDGQYNTFGAIWFQTPESSLRSLFHDPIGNWSPSALVIFFALYFLLGCWTYGLSISSGLFIPTLLIGAAWGRLFGIGMTALMGTTDDDAFCPAKFAIIGAAAMLGGVVRMTISLTVILMEAIGDITFGLPIMITVMIAKWVGDYFNEGLYDIHIQLASVPILSWEPPPNSYHIYASKVMSSPVVCFKTTENVATIISALENETHNGFPVVDIIPDSCDGTDTFGVFRGLILRWQLIVLLQHKMFNETAERSWRSQKLSLKDFRDAYPRHPPVQQIHISPLEESYSIDLRPYMNPSSYTISSSASLPRIFRLFRALGLRHLTVVNDRNNVVGMVTRKDIARFRARHNDGDLEELIISVS